MPFNHLLIFPLLLFSLTSSQSLSDLSFSDGTEISKALFSPSVGRLEASLGIRYLYIQSIARYEIASACQPSALSFFGTKDPIPSTLCAPLNSAIIRAYILYRIYREQYPNESVPLGTYLSSLGLKPDDDYNSDTDTASGWANFIANRANNYLSKDGWNSQGDLSKPKSLRRPYGDTTGFVPDNKAEIPADGLPKPLRWQPLEESSGSTGGYKYQTFNTPQLATAMTLALSKKDVSQRNALPPYKHMDRRELASEDALFMKKQVREFFEVSKTLTSQQRFLARWWENKRISLGSFLPFYAEKLGLSDWEETYLQLAQFVAMHDSIVVGWKEKVKWNSVRPSTMVKKFYTGKKVRVFIDEQIGTGFINGEDYQPLFPVQAHGEYPSGSALLCTTGLDVLHYGLNDIGKGVPVYEKTFEPGAFGFPHSKQIKIKFNTLQEGAKTCGEARLWGGVHFPPSVAQGEILSKDIGRIAYQQVRALVNGTVPESCKRCE